MTRKPDFRELLTGEDLSPEERARLERVHGLLIEAGPPPELTPALAEPETAEPEMPIQLPRRRAGAMLALAATIALHPLGGGDRKSTRLNSSHSQISYAVFCLNKEALVEQAAA